jgi:transcriptional regulator with PAS, ATPase and Fis domain
MANRSKATDRLNRSDAGKDPALHGAGLPGEVDSQLVLRAAQSNCTILITGETGVGKGHLARWIHDHSNRADGPFIPVNCGAIPDALIDSQLFGHARGAFSGATHDHLGLVRAAEHGTMLLDEISELPLSAQNRLLRLLQEREVQPVGHSRPITVDVRIIAATNIDLAAAVAERKFREDLLFRMDVIRLHVKPLRERPNEFLILLKGFNDEFAQLYRQSPLDFDIEAIHLLASYPWPGNVRQLRSLMERLHVLCPGEQITAARIIELGHLNPRPQPGRALVEVERIKLEQVRQVLAESGGSIAQAAEAFGVHRSTIYRWLRPR